MQVNARPTLPLFRVYLDILIYLSTDTFVNEGDPVENLLCVYQR